MCCRASIGSLFSATSRRIGRGSLVECAGAVIRSWGSGGGLFWRLGIVLSAARLAEDGARLEDVREEMRPRGALAAGFCSPAFFTRGLAVFVWVAGSPAGVGVGV